MTYRLRNLLIALGLAIVAVIFVSVYVTQYKRHVRNDESAVQVYVADRNIAVGTPGDDVVDGNYLRKTSIERRNVVPGAISSPDEIGSSFVTEPIYTGEQVSLRRFGKAGAEGLRGQLRGNQRAFEIQGESWQVLAGTLETGDKVDVVASWTAPEGASHHVAKVVLRDILVLKAPEVGGIEGGDGKSTASVQLRVTDTQSSKLFFLVKNGDWSLTLRPPTKAGDSGEAIKDAVTIASEGVGIGALSNAMQGTS